MKKIVFFSFFLAIVSIAYAQEKWSGTGFAIGNGYLVTNYHVVENTKSISVQGIKGSFNTSYNANIAAIDKKNDLAIIKIDDINFKGFGTIPYRVKTTTSDVGEDVFVLGYPLTTTMGEEVKLTTGVISSKTGFQGDVSMYQISAPIQPGNSGGPLFDGKGNIIGVVSAKHLGAENVSYAIKASYLNILIETISGVTLPSNNTLSTLSLSEKVKRVDDFVFLISCLSKVSADNSKTSINISNTTKTINNPSVKSTSSKHTKINKVTIASNFTAIEITYTNNNHYSYGINISPCTYISAFDKTYKLLNADNITISPNNTPIHDFETLTFTLYFPPIPFYTTSIDLIESEYSKMKWYGISLK